MSEEDNNPYQTPIASVEADTDATTGGLISPQKVEAGRGSAWLFESFPLFGKAAGLWIVGFIVLTIIYIVVAMIPILGSFAVYPIWPMMIAGYLVAAKAADEDQDVELGQFFAGFQRNVSSLALLGLAMFIGTLVIIIVCLIVFFIFGGSGMMEMFSSMQNGQEPDMERMFSTMGMPLLLAGLVYLALIIPVIMALWFAPALVMFHDLGVMDAMKMSFDGCLKNFIPYLIYGIVALVLMFIAMIPLGLGMLVMVPVINISIYVAYKDIFLAKQGAM